MSTAAAPIDRPSEIRTRYKIVIIAAVVGALAYLVMALLSPRFEYGQDTQARPIVAVLALLAVAFAAHLFGLWAALRLPEDRRLVWTIVAVAVLFRAILVPTAPIQELDIYRYLWDGAVSTQGVSPFRFAPQQVIAALKLDTSASDELPDELSGELRRVSDLCHEQPPLSTILSRVHYGELPTVYPPVSQVVFAACAWFTPADSSVAMRMTVLKGVLVLFDLATLALVIALLRLTGRHVGWGIAYGWCPLVIKEFANSGHLDSIAVFLTTAAVYVVVRALFPREEDNAPPATGPPTLAILAAAVLLALAVGAKLYPVVLAPLFAVTVWRHFGLRQVVAAAVTFLLLATVVLLPMASRTQGLATFFGRWEMNDLLFMTVYENLRPQTETLPDRLPWFSIVPESQRDAITEPVANAFDLTQRRGAFFITRVLTVGVWLVVALTLAWRAAKTDKPTDWLGTCFLTLAWFWLLSPTQNPWYWTWALPLVPFVRGRAWLALSALVLVYYLRFWLRYHCETTPVLGTRYPGVPFFDLVVTWFEYGPWLLWLTVAAALRGGILKPRDGHPEA